MLNASVHLCFQQLQVAELARMHINCKLAVRIHAGSPFAVTHTLHICNATSFQIRSECDGF